MMSECNLDGRYCLLSPILAYVSTNALHGNVSIADGTAQGSKIGATNSQHNQQRGTMPRPVKKARLSIAGQI